MDTARFRFFRLLAEMASPEVMELGTKQQHDRPTSHRLELQEYIPALRHVGVDLEPGIDVDVVADVHNISKHFRAGRFDGFVAAAVFEHLQIPWLAAIELNKVTRLGGIGYVQTHQSFPLHYYPSDYWRFSLEGLAVLFGADTGWEVLHGNYRYPCAIVPLENLDPQPWNFEAKSWLNVEILVRKIAEPAVAVSWPYKPDGQKIPGSGILIP
jgi:hypothetical protein